MQSGKGSSRCLPTAEGGKQEVQRVISFMSRGDWNVFLPRKSLKKIEIIFKEQYAESMIMFLSLIWITHLEYSCY